MENLAVKAKFYVCICIGTIYILPDHNTPPVFTQSLTTCDENKISSKNM